MSRGRGWCCITGTGGWEHHPHVHALVLGGGPALDGRRWVASRQRTQPRRIQPYLVDHKVLSGRFRDTFVAGLTGSHQRDELALTRDWSHLREPAAFDAWRQAFCDRPWVVYIEPPPTAAARPENVLRYLARYLTGGPIFDRRLLDHQEGQITFSARSKGKRAGNPAEPYKLSGVEFARRWALHILPKGFVKSRGFGGRHRRQYLRRCRELLPAAGDEPQSVVLTGAPPAVDQLAARHCPRCQSPLECVDHVERPSWNAVFSHVARPA